MVDISKITSDGAAPVNSNPANPNPAQMKQTEVRRKRVPVSAATRKLEAPQIEGFSLYWFLESNVTAAVQGGYDFVLPKETHLNQHGLANSSVESGNTDLGSRVSIATTSGNGAERLYLMKIRLEWFNEDQQALAKQNADRLEAIFTKEQVFSQNGMENPNPTVYVNENSHFQGNRALFNRRRALK